MKGVRFDNRQEMKGKGVLSRCELVLATADASWKRGEEFKQNIERADGVCPWMSAQVSVDMLLSLFTSLSGTRADGCRCERKGRLS